MEISSAQSSTDAEITERLKLRPLKPEDAPQIFAIRSYEEVHKQLLVTENLIEVYDVGAEQSRSKGAWLSLLEAQVWIEIVLSRPDNLIYSVLLRNPAPNQENQIIGIVGLNQYGTLLYYFHPNFWGAGYCTEAVHTYLVILFEQQPDRECLDAGVLKGNKTSQRILEKCGFISFKGQAKERREGLTTEEEDDLKSAVASLGLPTRPLVDRYAKDDAARRKDLTTKEEAGLKSAARSLVERSDNNNAGWQGVMYRYERLVDKQA
jgi:RimJ/RimL family protein N-acetyltransferase